MNGIKVCIFLTLLITVSMRMTDAKPLFWDLLGLGRRSGGRSAPSGRVDKDPADKTYGDICRVLNPSPWSATGVFMEPNCPP